MKKKLSLLLAALLVMTLVPVSSFAIKTTGDSDAFSVDYDSDDISKYTVKVEMQSDTLASGKYVRFNLENAVFENQGINVTKESGSADGTVAAKEGSTTGTFTFDAPTAKNDVFYFELEVSTKESNVGDVNLSLSGAISKDSFKIGVVEEASSKDLSVKLIDTKEKTISASGGALAKFEVKNYDKKGTNTTPDPKEVVITIDDDVASFDTTSGTGTTVDALGLATSDITITSSKITIKNVQNANYIIVSPVMLGQRKMELGSVNVNVVQGDNDTTAKIGSVVEYNATMTATALGKKEIATVTAGKTSDVKVTIESTKGTLSRDMEFTLDGAKVAYKKDSGKDTGTVTGISSPITGGTIVESTVTGVTEAEGTTDEFSITPTAGATKVVFNMKVVVSSTAKDGIATLTLDTKDLDDSLTVDVVKVDKAFTVDTKVTEIKRGESLETADITITESKAGQIASGDYVQVIFNGKLLFNEKPEIEATNGMKFDDVEWIKIGGDTIGVQAKVTSKSKNDPAEITLSGMSVDMLANAIHNRVYTASLFVGAKTSSTGSNAGDPTATEYAEFDYAKCVAEYAKATPQIVFTLGSANYTINGVVNTLEAPVFTKDNRTMLPIGPLALAMGLEVNYNADTQTATFRDPQTGQIVSVKENADILYNNGIQYKMHTSAVTVNGRIFVPVASITDAFGAKIVWNEAAQTVTIN